MILRLDHASCDLVVPGERLRFVDHGDGGAAVISVEDGALAVTLTLEQGWSPDPARDGAVTLAIALQVLGRLPVERPGAMPQHAVRDRVQAVLATPLGCSVEEAAASAVDAVLDALAASLGDAAPTLMMGPLAGVVGADLAARLSLDEARFPPSDDLFDALSSNTLLVDTVVAEVSGSRPFGGPLVRLDKSRLAQAFRVLASAGVFRLQAFGTPGGAITTVTRLRLVRGSEQAWVEAPMPVLRTGDPDAIATLWPGGAPAGELDLEEISVQVSGRIRRGRKPPPPALDWTPPGLTPPPLEGPGWTRRLAGPVWVPAGAIASAVDGYLSVRPRGHGTGPRSS